MSTEIIYSPKGKELIGLYKKMASEGYDMEGQKRVPKNVGFSNFNIKFLKNVFRQFFIKESISSILDYGSGGCDWDALGFDGNSELSAKTYFNLKNAFHYEPGRSIDERQKVDCVVSTDVLEHLFIADVPNVLRDIFSYANEWILLVIACYPALSKLPNGENAHTTVREGIWWKGVIDSISTEFPKTKVLLGYKPDNQHLKFYQPWSVDLWQEKHQPLVNEFDKRYLDLFK